MTDKFYGIGVGPGDPELITVKGLNALKRADVIFAPKATIKGESLAREIVEGLFADKKDEEKKEFIELEFPMTKDEEELKNRYATSARLILDAMKADKVVAYLTIGDPLLYSTYIYLLDALKELAPKVVVETIPGIAAYSALAASLNYSLVEKDARIAICPVPKKMTELREVIESNDTTVIMKVAKKLPEVVGLLADMGLTDSAIFGSRVGQKNEKLVDGRAEPFEFSEKEGYLSTIIVRKATP
ncbi:MAG: precorrin-2 C(20)-methyltransferase [Deltaproteobacteria bacterium]|nr:precorrin-2 C(20)-methyltransferase [Deltaproteobacteria bacterium]